MADVPIRFIPKSPTDPLPIKVYHGRYVGRIVEAPGGFQYIAKGGFEGEVFPSVAAVKSSVIGED